MSVRTAAKPERSLTEIRISMLFTFIQPSRGVCRETCTTFHRIDCQSFLSERSVSWCRSCRSVRVCASTYAIAHTYQCVHVYRSEIPWRNFSIVDTHHRVLREFKIPLTTPSRYPDIRYKSHILVSVRTDIHRYTRTYTYANVFTHVDLTQSLFRYRAAALVSAQSMRVGRPLWGSYEILAKDTVWLDEKKDGERGKG